MSKMEEGEGFLEAPEAKYTVSRDFRIPDLNRFAIKIINKKTIGQAFLSSDADLNEVKFSNRSPIQTLSTLWVLSTLRTIFTSF